MNDVHNLWTEDKANQTTMRAHVIMNENTKYDSDESGKQVTGFPKLWGILNRTWGLTLKRYDQWKLNEP